MLVEGARALVERHGIGTRGGPRAHRVGGPPGGRRPGGGLRAGEASAAPASSARWAPATTSSRLQRVERVIDAAAAEAFGLREGQVTVLIHSGSRGLGHQVCTDYVQADGHRDRPLRDRAARPPARLRAALLARGPGLHGGDGLRGQLRLGQPPGDRPPRARGGRERPRRRRRRGHPAGLRRRPQRGQAGDATRGREVCVHRKGATRAFPAGSAEIPAAYRDVGQPVFIPGSMGTSSFVLRRAAGRRWSAPSAPPATARGGG